MVQFYGIRSKHILEDGPRAARTVEADSQDNGISVHFRPQKSRFPE